MDVFLFCFFFFIAIPTSNSNHSYSIKSGFINIGFVHGFKAKCCSIIIQYRFGIGIHHNSLTKYSLRFYFIIFFFFKLNLDVCVMFLPNLFRFIHKYANKTSRVQDTPKSDTNFIFRTLMLLTIFKNLCHSIRCVNLYWIRIIGKRKSVK